jgi:uracil-DNA glycosylase
MQPRQIALVETTGVPTCVEQDLVALDVADTGEEALSHERRLDRTACLLHDIERSEPGALLALRRSAMAAFGICSSIEQARGRAFRHTGTPLLVTYHPQYLAYRGGNGGPIWRAMVRDLAGAWRAGDRQDR